MCENEEDQPSKGKSLTKRILIFLCLAVSVFAAGEATYFLSGSTDAAILVGIAVLSGMGALVFFIER